MIVSITGVLGGADLSGYLDRSAGLEIESSTGKRMDTCRFSLFDPDLNLAIPDRAEMWIYDARPPTQYERYFGTDSDGTLNGWSLDSGTMPTISANVVTIGVVGTTIYRLPVGTDPDYTWRVRVQLVSGSQPTVLIRRTSSGDYVRAVLINPDRRLYVEKSISGVRTQIAFPATVLTAGNWYYLELKARGTTFTATVYADTADGPGAVVVTTGPITVTDASVQGVGGFGIANPGGATAAATMGGIRSGVGALGDNVIDPAKGKSAYNTWLNGVGKEQTAGDASWWTPRMFAGFVSQPGYGMTGAQRQVALSAQDYTFRLRSTVANIAFVGGISDQSMVQSLFASYRPDVDTSNVQQTVASMPAISFPVHSLEQFLERIVKITRASYRLDYFKRLYYGTPGFLAAPFGLSDNPTLNQVPNPSFEPGLAGWLLYNNGPESAALVAVADGTAFDGLQFARVTWPSANTSSKGLMLATGEVYYAVGPTYVVSFYARATGGAVGSTMQLAWNQGPSQTTALLNPPLTGAWQRYAFRINWTAGPLDPNTFITIAYAGGQAAGSLDIDAVQIEVGFQPAPFTVGYTVPMEGLTFSPDATGLVNKVWVMGARYLSKVQTWQVPPSLVNGSNYQFNLPGDPETSGMVVTVGGVDQGVVGVVPADGDFADQSSFKKNVLISHSPAIISFKITPAAATALVVTGKFRYPLITTVQDPALIAQTGGTVFETVARDRRLDDLNLAQQTGTSFLKNQGASQRGGSVTTRTRSYNGVLLQPGQYLPITHSKLFAGGVLKDTSGNPITSASFLITRLRFSLDDDTVQPYEVAVEFADRYIPGDSSDLVDALLDVDARINDATANEDINALVADFQQLTADKVGLTETVTPSTTSPPHSWGDQQTAWGFFSWRKPLEPAARFFGIRYKCT